MVAMALAPHGSLLERRCVSKWGVWMRNRRRFKIDTIAAWALLCGAGLAEPPIQDNKSKTPTPAQLFGQREDVIDISLSPDGKHVVLVAPGPGVSTYAIVMDTDTRAVKPVFKQDGKPLNIVSCGWASNSRIACKLWGVSFDNGPAIPYSRTIAVDMDGKNPTYLGRAKSTGARISQFDGDIVDWRQGDGSVLMTRDYVPGEDDRTGSDADGLGVDLVDTMTGKSSRVEKADRSASDYLSDGQGTIRFRASLERDDTGLLTGATTYLYR